MGNIIIISGISFFAVFGVYLMIREIFRTHFCPCPDRIVLRVRNCENYIEYTLRALLIQYPSSCIIVEDDNSVDRTVEIVSHIADNNSRVQLRARD